MKTDLIKSLKNILNGDVRIKVWKIHEEKQKSIEETRESFVLEFLQSDNRELIVIEKTQEKKLDITSRTLLGLGIKGLDKEDEEELIFLLYLRDRMLLCQYIDRLYGGPPTIYTIIDEEKKIHKIRKPIVIAEFRLKR